MVLPLKEKITTCMLLILNNVIITCLLLNNVIILQNTFVNVVLNFQCLSANKLLVSVNRHPRQPLGSNYSVLTMDRNTLPENANKPSIIYQFVIRSTGIADDYC